MATSSSSDTLPSSSAPSSSPPASASECHPLLSPSSLSSTPALPCYGGGGGNDEGGGTSSSSNRGGGEGGNDDDDEGGREDSGYPSSLSLSSSSCSSADALVKPPLSPSPPDAEALLHPLRILAILSTASAYGSVATTLFLLTLPLECQSIEESSGGSVSKSVALGGFAAVAGASQLICPLMGALSDRFVVTQRRRKSNLNEKRGGGIRGIGGCLGSLVPEVRGRRLPYLILGALLSLLGLWGMRRNSFDLLSSSSSSASSSSGSSSVSATTNSSYFSGYDYGSSTSASSGSDCDYDWAPLLYIFFFVLAMIGINVVYCVMIALIPDLVPSSQTGLANGTLALLLVGGSLTGFAAFHTFLNEELDGMYGFYMHVMWITVALTYLSANGLTKEEEDPLGLEDDKAASATAVYADNALSSDLASPSKAEDARRSKCCKCWCDCDPFSLLRRMFLDPLASMTSDDLLRLYTVSPAKHFDFAVVTFSRTLYYAGLSSQAFFLYYVHDVIRLHSDPEAAVATLAVVGQCAGAITCYPVGWFSDKYCGGRRRPFVYGACLLLAGGNLALLACRTMSQAVGVCAMLGAANGVYLTMDTSLAVDTLPKLKEEAHTTEEEGKRDADDATKEGVDAERGDRTLPRGGRDGIGGDGEGGGKQRLRRKEAEDGSAQLLGVWGVAGFVGTALGPLVGGPLLYIFGTVTGDNGADGNNDDDNYSGEEYSWFGYCLLFSMSATSFLLSALVLRWVRAKDV